MKGLTGAGTNRGIRCLIHRRPSDAEIAESPARRVGAHRALEAASRSRVIRPVGELGRNRLHRLVGSCVLSAASAIPSRNGNPSRSGYIARVRLQRDTHDRLPVGKRPLPGIRRPPNFAPNRANLHMVGANRNSAFPFVTGRGRRCPGVGDRHRADAVFPVVGTRKRRRTRARSLEQVASSLRLRRRSGRPNNNRVPLDGSSDSGGRAAMLQCSRHHAVVLDS
jgi:hypothetical protein